MIDAKILRQAALKVAQEMELEAVAVVAVDQDGSTVIVLSNNEAPQAQKHEVLDELAQRLAECSRQAQWLAESSDDPDSSN